MESGLPRGGFSSDRGTRVGIVDMLAARGRSSRVSRGRSFIMVAASADSKGSSGMEVWLGHGSSAAHCQFLVAEPRRLMLRAMMAVVR